MRCWAVSIRLPPTAVRSLSVPTWTFSSGAIRDRRDAGIDEGRAVGAEILRARPGQSLEDFLHAFRFSADGEAAFTHGEAGESQGRSDNQG